MNGTATTSCTRAGCARPAAGYPVIRFWAAGDAGRAPEEAATATFPGLRLCSACRAVVTLEDLSATESWQAFERAFAAAEKPAPDRASAGLLFAELAQ